MYGHWLYLIQSELGYVKIGITANVERRLDSLQTSSPSRLKLYQKVGCPNVEAARRLEKLLHKRYASNRVNREWFDIDPEIVVNEIAFAIEVYEAMTGVNRKGRAKHG